MENLPTSSIGLIAFIIIAFGGMLKYIADKGGKNTDTFMTYIQKKNENLERTSKNFTDTIEKMQADHQQFMRELINNRKK